MNNVEYIVEENLVQLNQAIYLAAFEAFEKALALGSLEDMSSAYADILSCEVSRRGEDYEFELNKLLKYTPYCLDTQQVEVTLKPDICKLEVDGKIVEVNVTEIDEDCNGVKMAMFEISVDDFFVARTGEWLDEDDNVVCTERNNDYNPQEMRKVRDALGLDQDAFYGIEDEIFGFVSEQAKLPVAA